uniref:Uncharacterized protein n=1 Tax=Rhizophora mucronata TaxID=61149 RepID=A0A2P2QR57_RHIMU
MLNNQQLHLMMQKQCFINGQILSWSENMLRVGLF